MIIDALLQKFPNMPNLRVRDIVVDKMLLHVSCVVSYPDARSLPAEITSEIRKTVAESLPKRYKCEVKIVNDKFTAVEFCTFLHNYLKKKFPVYSHLKREKFTATVEGFSIVASIKVNKTDRRSMELNGVLKKLSEFLKWYTCYKVTVTLSDEEPGEEKALDRAQQERLVQLALNKELMKPQRYFRITGVVRHVGKKIDANPMYISDVRSQMESCVVCGRISEKDIRGPKNNPTLKICKFNLSDDSGGTIPCVVFVRFQIEDVETLKQTNAGLPESEIVTLAKKRHVSNDEKLKRIAFLGNGMEVVVRGKVVYSEFSERLELQVKDICKCKIEPINSQPKVERPIPENYTLVFPEKMEEYRQVTLLDVSENKSRLTGNDFVVLCANVTGYNVTKDKVFALAAVRIKDGRTVEKFYTAVAPETVVNEDLLKSANVTHQQLIVSPTLTEIIGDLLKFVQKTALIGTDLGKLLDLLNYYAAPLGYNFNNEILSGAEVLSAMFDESTFSGNKPNCAVVADVAKALKVQVRNSTNCGEIASALADCLVTLGKMAK